MNTSMRAFGLLLSFASLAAFAPAGVIYNNLGPGNSFGTIGQILQGPGVGTIGNVDQAVRFTTNGNFHNSISVQAGISVDGPQPDGSGDLTIAIAADTGGSGPGAILASDTLSLGNGTFGPQLVGTSFSSLNLDPNTDYWVVLDAQNTFDGSWLWNDQGITGVSAGRTNLGPWSIDSNDDNVFSLRVVSRKEVTPEPASVVALGLGAVAVLRRRKKA